MRKLRYLFALLMMLASASHTFAQSAASIGNISAAANSGSDQSMNALKLVFGSVVSNPLSSGGGSGGMIASIFATLNASVLAIGAIFAFYLFFAAMVSTGQDGEFLGQKRSSIWFTIRNGIGFSLLVPFAGGYSGAQLIVLWATMIGVGIANLSMSTATNVLVSGGTLVANPAPPQVQSLSKSLFEANLCAQAATIGAQNLPNDTGGVTVDAGETFRNVGGTGQVALVNGNGLSCGGASVALKLPGASFTGNSGAMGFMAVDTNAVVSTLQNAQQTALATMQTTLENAAKTYVAAVNSGTAPADPSSIIDRAALAYQQSIQSQISAAGGSISGLANQVQSQLQQNGWIMLGAWYQTFALANSELSNSASTVATSIAPSDPGHLPYPDLYNNVLAVYHQQIARDAVRITPSAGAADASGSTSFWQSMSSDPSHLLAGFFPGQRLVNLVTTSVSNAGTGKNVNPLIGMKNMGDYIIMSGEGLLAAYALVGAEQGATSQGMGWLASKVASVGTLGVSDSVKGAVEGAIDKLGPIIILLLVALFFFGVMLSIYLPMLPFMVWFGGILSWYAVVCEGVVAAPLWAFSHLDGEGEGMGQRTTHGYTFMLNLMLRPAFMVIGFLLASVGISVFGALLNVMFAAAMANAQYNSITGIVSIVGYVALYVGMCQTLCQTLFGMINHIPNVSFAWLGASMHNTFGQETHDKSHNIIAGAVKSGGGQVERGLIGRTGPARPNHTVPKAPGGTPGAP